MKRFEYTYLPLFIVYLLIPRLAFPQTSELISFELEDQFERTYNNESFNDKMMVMIGSDGGGSKYNSKWGQAISDALKKQDTKYDINWVGVADLRGVPFFMKGYVRNQFSEDEKEWVLLDWDGLFAETYNFEDGMSNIFVFNSKGTLVFKAAAREVEDEKLNTILKAIHENHR